MNKRKRDLVYLLKVPGLLCFSVSLTQLTHQSWWFLLLPWSSIKATELSLIIVALLFDIVIWDFAPILAARRQFQSSRSLLVLLFPSYISDQKLWKASEKNILNWCCIWNKMHIYSLILFACVFYVCCFSNLLAYFSLNQRTDYAPKKSLQSAIWNSHYSKWQE